MGKSTLAKFLKQQINAPVKLLSTEVAKESIEKHIGEDKEPILHAPTF